MSMRDAYTAILVQGENWSDYCESEPYEAPWASEALVFLRLLDGTTTPGGIVARVQISPDGIHWADEGSTVEIPKGAEVTFVKVREFGHYLRLVVDLPKGVDCILHATVSFKS